MDQETLAAWQATQDGFASLSGLSLLSFDPQRSLVCAPSRENPICAAVQCTDVGERHCQAHCGKAVAMAVETTKPVFLKCEANLHVFTVPIVVEGKVALILQGGKVFIAEEERIPTERLIVRTNLPEEAFVTLAKDQPPVDNARVLAAGRYVEQAARALLESRHTRATIGSKLSSVLTLFSLVADLQQEPDTEIFCSTVLNSIGVLFDVNTVGFLSVNGTKETLLLSQAFGYKKDLLQGYRASAREGLLHQVLAELRHLRTEETREILKMGLPGTVHSVDLFPLVLPDARVEGVILILDSTLKPDDVQILEAFCAQTSLVLHNRLLEHRLQDAAKRDSAISRIAQELGSTLDTDQLFDLILERLVSLVDAEKGSLMLLDEQEGSLAVKAAKGLNMKLLQSVRVAPHQGICGKVLATGASLLVSDLETDERVSQQQRPRYRTKSFISLPLKLNHRTIGVLNISDKISGEVFSVEDLERLSAVATYASVVIERGTYYRKAEELKRISTMDPLTQLANRRSFEERLLEEVQRAKRHESPLSLVMVDLDDFKKINDRYGHPAGDEALRMTARIIRQTIRTIDVACRYGGEEFAIILPQTGKPGAAVIAERICAEFRKLDLPVQQADRWLKVTGSLGVACFPEDADSPEALIQQADIALYSAKLHGKDQVVVFERH